MMNIYDIKVKMKSRLGELWWYTIIMFMTQQLGSVINAVIGLWLVPKYVPKEELGALLPLASIGSLLGLPLTILMIPFMKFLTKYMAQEEYGKVKSLLRDVFILAGVTFLVVSGLAYLFMPLVFERMRVENGILSLLIICSGTIGALAPVFSTALQALKRFKMMSLLGFMGSLVRFGTLLIALPVRGLSGYFVGQLVALIFGILASLWALRRYLSFKVKRISYWSEDWKLILRYIKWIALLYVAWTLQGAVESFVIRHRLPAIESAGYYMISRFAEISTYIGLSVMVVIFPLVSERSERGQVDNRLLKQSILSSLVFGLVVSCLLFFIGKWVMGLVNEWRIYIVFQPLLVWLGVLFTMRSCISCFTLHEMAMSRFSAIKWLSAVSFIEASFLYSMFSTSLLYSYFPNQLTEWVSTLKVNTLSSVLCVITVFVSLQFCIVIHAMFFYKSTNEVQHV